MISRIRMARAWFIPIGLHRPEPTAPRRRRRMWLAVALLAGYLLFCHGCHGDEDNELFTSMRTPAALQGPHHDSRHP